MMKFHPWTEEGERQRQRFLSLAKWCSQIRAVLADMPCWLDAETAKARLEMAEAEMDSLPWEFCDGEAVHKDAA